MDIRVGADGILHWRGRRLRCILGKGGVRADKREGDGATPVGCFALRRVFYRPDRVPAPVTGLPVAALTPRDGWCDDPAHPDYNRPVNLPHPARHEAMWRDDHAYDVVVVLGYNDDPPVPGLGSAIFMHLARPDGAGTEGCVALALPDLLEILEHCDAATRLCVEA
jgi:L,D-peptidoglycan transpeptidase YkuD (ErfK/YbiS/YcfS/YnhG family)